MAIQENIRGLMVFKIPTGQLATQEADALMDKVKAENATLIEKLRSNEIECVFLMSRGIDPGVELIKLNTNSNW